MNEHEWTAVLALFPEALALTGSARAAFLAHHCAGAPALQAELEALLTAADSEPDFLARPIGLNLVNEDFALLPPGTRLGAWELGGLLGHGGMGDVYAAFRADGSFAMDAALKVLKRGLDTDAILRRSRRERDILARLAHPNIARLLDAGATEDGRPFLVMERVQGVSITDHCAQRGSPIAEILGLMVTVCTAVAEAHRQLVVHRDLKPSNVLVSDDGQVKLLDFGIAKLLTAGTSEVPGTMLGEEPLTPAYAAPEQLLGAPITTATDVYALGVMLYRLLTGLQPHRRERLTLSALRAGLDAENAVRPSEAVVAAGSSLPAADRHQRARILRGDLDLIVLKALAPEPERRYGSARELGDDLNRWLAKWPVRARPDSTRYRAQRFLRRNRLLAAAGGAAVLALSAGLTTALWQAHVARLQLDRALISEARTQVVTGYLMRRVGESDRKDEQNLILSPRNVLGTASGRVRQVLVDEPATAAGALLALGEMHAQIGNDPSAEAEFRQLLAAFPIGSESAALAEARHRLAEIVYRLYGDSAEARALLSAAQAWYRRFPERNGEALENALLTEAALERDAGHFNRAVAVLEPLEALAVKRSGAISARHLELLEQRAVTEFDAGDLERAAAHYRDALAIFPRLGTGVQDQLLISLDTHCDLAGRLAGRVGDLEQAEACARRAIAVRQQHSGDSASLAAGHLVLGNIRLAQGQTADAGIFLRDGLEIAEQNLPAPATLIAKLRDALIQALRDSGAADQAKTHIRARADAVAAGQAKTPMPAVARSIADAPAKAWDLSANVLATFVFPENPAPANPQATNPAAIDRSQNFAYMKGLPPIALPFYSAPCPKSKFALRCWHNGGGSLPAVYMAAADSLFDNGTSLSTYRRGLAYLHPSVDEPAVVRWTAPSAALTGGTVSIRARFWDFDHSARCMEIGDGVGWTIALNGVPLPGARGAISNREDAVVFAADAIEVVPGSTLDFIVDGGGEGNVFCDSTGLELRISPS